MKYNFGIQKVGRVNMMVDPAGGLFFKELSGPAACQLRAMALHEVDVSFCESALVALQDIDYNDESTLAVALWTSAITKFFKCFTTNKSRVKLSQSKIFLQPELLAVFNYFLALRNKHIVHDENGFSNSHVVAAIRSSERDLQSIFVTPVHVVTISEPEIGRLLNLARLTLRWIEAQKRDLQTILAAEFATLKTAEILTLPDWIISAPESDEIHKPR